MSTSRHASRCGKDAVQCVLRHSDASTENQYGYNESTLVVCARTRSIVMLGILSTCSLDIYRIVSGQEETISPNRVLDMIKDEDIMIRDLRMMSFEKSWYVMFSPFLSHSSIQLISTPTTRTQIRDTTLTRSMFRALDLMIINGILES